MTVDRPHAGSPEPTTNVYFARAQAASNEFDVELFTPGGAAAFNVHDGTKLYASTLLTLAAVFPNVHVYPSGEGEAIVVVTAAPAPDDATLAARAAALQQRHNFRFPLPELLARRTDKRPAQKGELLTDDFAPVNLYDTIGERKNKKK